MKLADETIQPIEKTEFAWYKLYHRSQVGYYETTSLSFTAGHFASLSDRYLLRAGKDGCGKTWVSAGLKAPDYLGR